MKYLSAVLALFLPLMTAGQETAKHPTNIERFSHIRILPPADVTAYNGKSLEYKVEDRLQVVHGKFSIDDQTNIPGNFAKAYKKHKWWLFFCIEHQVVLIIEEYIPKKGEPESVAKRKENYEIYFK